MFDLSSLTTVLQAFERCFYVRIPIYTDNVVSVGFLLLGFVPFALLIGFLKRK